MSSNREIPAYLVGVAVLVAIVILTLTNHGVPAVLWAVFGSIVGGGLGITIPGGARSSAASSTSSSLESARAAHPASSSAATAASSAATPASAVTAA